MKRIILLILVFFLLPNYLLYSQEYEFKDGIIQEKFVEVNSVESIPISIAKGIIVPNYTPQVTMLGNNAFLGLQTTTLLKSSSSGISNQDFFNLNRAPNAPKALKSIESNLQTSTDLYTGKQNINIPLYNFTSKEISVPITLSQSTPNIKSGQKESWTGFGWKLNVGGEITRKINGKADEGANGYFTTRSSEIENAKDLNIGDYYNGRRNKWDTAPDEFYFNFNGYSGSFMIHNGGLIGSFYITSDSQLRISPIYENLQQSTIRKLIGFTILDDKGYQYFFGKADPNAGDNTIEQIATKTKTTLVNSTVKGLLWRHYSNGTSKIYNFAPFNTAWVGNPLTGSSYFVRVADILPLDNSSYFTITGNAFTDDSSASKIEQSDLATTPVNVGWKLTKIESIFGEFSYINDYKADDVIKFEYDSGGWVEYDDVPQRTTYKFNFLGSNSSPDNNTVYFNLRVRNPNYQYCGVCTEQDPESFIIPYPGRRIPSRPNEWSSTTVHDRLPHISTKYYTKVYKKTSTLKKIINKYNEYVSFELGTHNIAGFDPLTSGNYGTAYTPKLLSNINLHDSNNSLIYTIANFGITYAGSGNNIDYIRNLENLDQKYIFEKKSNSYLIDKIIYPTGGNVTFNYIDNTIASVETNTVENTTLKKSFIFKDAVNYDGPKTEAKIDGNEFGFGLITQTSSSGIYGKLYSKGENKVFRTVESYLNDKLQSVHKFTTPLTHKDETNIAYMRGSSSNTINTSLHRKPPNLRDFERGHAETIIQYGKGDVKKTITTTNRTYETPYSLKAVRLGNFAYNGSTGYQIGGGNRTYSYYNYYFPKIKTSKTTTTSFYNNGQILKNINLTNFEKGYISEIKITDSKGDEIIQRFKYPFSLNYTDLTNNNISTYGFPYKALNTLNIVSKPIEKVAYLKKKNSNIERLLSAEVDLYRYRYDNTYLHTELSKKLVFESENFVSDYNTITINSSGSILNVLEKDSRLKSRANYELYDDFGNLQEVRLQDGTPITYLWGYDSRVVIGKIEGRTYASVSYALSQLNININTLKTSKDQNYLIQSFNQLRSELDDTLITSYTHKPLFGVTSITDNKGQTSYYEYDNFGKLKLLKDAEANVLKEYKYNFINPQ